MSQFVPIPDDFEPTRATLHQYANAVGIVPRAHAEPHEKWWHISLNVTPRGLETDTMASADGGSFDVRMDLRTHAVVITKNGEDVTSIDMSAGLTGTQMGEAIIAAVGDLGVTGEYATEKYESDDARQYDAAAAEAFCGIINNMADIYAKHRDAIGDRVSPIQLWPHGFDMAFEWFGTRIEEYEENGEVTQYPSQCNFGFYPGGRAYLYANPWPFEGDALLGVQLPGGAEWHTEGWEGSMLHYDQLVGDDAAESRVLNYLETVFEHAAPTLTA